MNTHTHYWAGYTKTTNHFVIQNLPAKPKTADHKFELLLRYLQRGTQMPLPQELRHKFEPDSESFVPLIPLQGSVYTEKWSFESKNDLQSRAKTLFLRERLTEYLPEWSFLKHLFCANLKLHELPEFRVEKNIQESPLAHEQIDFYLPLAELVVLLVRENRNTQQQLEQKLKNKGLYVVCFSPAELIEQVDLICEKMEWLRHQIEKPVFSQKLKEWNRAHINRPRQQIITQVWWKAALIRIQILTAELLLRGIWTMQDQNWEACFLMREKEQIPKEFVELAIRSVQLILCDLFKNNFSVTHLPHVSISVLFGNQPPSDSLQHSNKAKISVDFSVLQYWKDSPSVITVRNDYCSFYRFAFHSDEGKPLSKVQPVFSSVFDNNIHPTWTFEDETALLRSRFLYAQRTEGSKATLFSQVALSKALCRESLLLNMPFHQDFCSLLMWLPVLSASPALLVCASTESALDKADYLAKMGMDKVVVWHSEMSSTEANYAQTIIKQQRSFLLILTIDLLNTFTFECFLEECQSNQKISWSYFLVDEIHRFSEWSPQHEQNYLAIEGIYRRFLKKKNIPFVFSSHFLEDTVAQSIRRAFEIEEENFLSPITADELPTKFEFVRTDNNYQSLVKLLKQLHKQAPHQTGLIFTSNANGSTSVHLLAERLEFDLRRKVYPYSVSVPKNSPWDKETYFQKRQELRTALQKANELLVVSTRALRSGVNLEGVDFIVQYGLPESLTDLLDVSLRTRKKEFVPIFVIFQQEKDEQTLFNLFEPSTKLTQIRHMRREVSWLGGDMYQHLLKWASQVEPLHEEVEFIKQFYDKYCRSEGTKVVEIADIDFRVFSQTVQRKTTTARTIIRLFQLGIIDDWKLSEHSEYATFRISVRAHDQNTLRKHIFDYIHCHQPDFEIHKNPVYQRIFENKNYSILEKYLYLFLSWIQENIAYAHRKNLKEVYQTANQCAENVQHLTHKELAKRFINFSFINKTLYFAEQPSSAPPSFSIQELNWIVTEVKKSSKQPNFLEQLERWRKRLTTHLVLDFWKALTELHLKEEPTTPPQTLFGTVAALLAQANMRDQIVSELIVLGKDFSDTSKNFLAESILQHYPSYAKSIYAAFQDACSLNYLLHVEVEKMKRISSALI